MNISIYVQPDSVNGIEYLIRAFDLGLKFSSILIIDNKPSSCKAKSIVAERTGGLYEFKDLFDVLCGRGIPCYFIKSINSKSALDLIKILGIDLLVLGAPEIVHEETIKAVGLGILNCHPSDISIYRGCTNVEWAVYENKKISLSCHFITKEIDSGPLVLREDFHYSVGMTYAQLRTEIIYSQAKTMINGIYRLMNNPNLKYDIPPMGRYMDVIAGADFEKMLKKINFSEYVPC